MPGGRPTKYTPELGDEICEAIANKTPLARLCNERDHLPAARTVYRWLREHDEFCQNYARAKEEQADLMVEEMLEIADETDREDVQVARLRVDTRKWAASKFKPKKYGDLSKVELEGSLDIKQINIPQRPSREEWLNNIKKNSSQDAE